MCDYIFLPENINRIASSRKLQNVAHVFNSFFNIKGYDDMLI
jgi:hypothetical protein